MWEENLPNIDENQQKYDIDKLRIIDFIIISKIMNEKYWNFL